MRFPQYLNRPYRILWFEVDDLAVIMLFFLFGLVFSSWFFTGCFLGVLGYRRLKRKYPRGFLVHTLYFMGIKELKGYPTAFERRFLE